MNFLEGAVFFASSSFFQPSDFCQIGRASCRERVSHQCVSFFEEVLNT